MKAALEQAAHMGDEAFGVVRTRRGFGIRVPSDRYENVIMRLRPDDAQQFVGDRWEISGLPVTTGADAVKEFVDGWEVHPLFSFRKGWRRTWVVRAKADPFTNVVEHQTGFAVIQKYEPRPAAGNAARERWRPAKKAQLSAAEFPALRPAASRPARPSPTVSPAASQTVRPTAAADPSLEERIASAVATAVAPLAAQMAALQAGMRGNVDASTPAVAAAEPVMAAMEVEPAAVAEAVAEAAAAAMTDALQDGASAMTRPAAPERMNMDRHEEYSGPNS